MSLLEAAPTPAPQVPDEILSDEAVWDLWYVDQLARRTKPNTIRERKIWFRAFRRRLGKPVIEATRMDLMRLFGQLELKPSTVSTYMAACRRVYEVLQEEGFRIDNPAARLPRVHQPRVEPNPVSTADIETLLGGVYARTRMMILLAAYQGFRAGEVAVVHGRNIDWEDNTIKVVGGKGGFEPIRPLHPIVRAEAVSRRGLYPRDGFWFPVSDHGAAALERPVTGHSVSSTLSKAFERAGLKEKGHRPHHLRAWFATTLIESGQDLYTVQQAMRHASPATTSKHYIKPSATRMSAAMETLPAIAIPQRSNRNDQVAKFPAPWRPAVAMWRSLMATQRVPATTVRDRMNILRRVAEAAPAGPEAVSTANVQAIKRDDHAVGTLRNYMIAIDAFYTFLNEHGLSERNPVPQNERRRERVAGVAHGTPRKYDNGCRCSECVEGKRAKRARQLANRIERENAAASATEAPEGAGWDTDL